MQGSVFVYRTKQINIRWTVHVFLKNLKNSNLCVEQDLRLDVCDISFLYESFIHFQELLTFLYHGKTKKNFAFSFILISRQA